MSESVAAIIAIGILIILLFIGVKYFNNYTPVRVAFIVIFVLSLIAAIYLGIRAWGPNGHASIFFDNDNEMTAGDTDITTVATDKVSGDIVRDNTEIYADIKANSEKYGDNAVIIIVKQDTISFNEVEFRDISDFESFFMDVSFADKELHIVDCYGSSKTMHEVLSIVEKSGIDYIMEQR